MLPDYAQPTYIRLNQFIYHEIFNVSVPLLNNATLSFHWITLAWEAFSYLNGWLNYVGDAHYTIPKLLVIGKQYNNIKILRFNNRQLRLMMVGIEVYHMMGFNGNDHRSYQEHLAKLVALLEQFHRRGSRIVWMNQYPVDPTLRHFPFREDQLYITESKLQSYNRLARHILQYRAYF